MASEGDFERKVRLLRNAAFKEFKAEDITVCYQHRGYEFCDTQLQKGTRLSSVRIISDKQSKIEITFRRESK